MNSAPYRGPLTAAHLIAELSARRMVFSDASMDGEVHVHALAEVAALFDRGGERHVIDDLPRTHVNS